VRAGSIALVAGLLAGFLLAQGCDTLVDHDGASLLDVPDGGPGVLCGLPDAGTHLCGNACVLEDEASCGSTCADCSTHVDGGVPACVAHLCSFECSPGYLRCGDACCRAAAVATGAQHTCAIAGTRLRCWGSNDQGQLGRSAGASSSDTPVDVDGLPLGVAVSLVAAGPAHTCAVLADGRLFCWGANASNQVGAGSTSIPVPQEVALSGVTSLALGARHTCAVASGALYCWGANDRGQLGGATAGSTPSPVPGLGSGVTQVASGVEHTCALQAGALLCWGSNDKGQLGTGGGDSATPQTVTLPGASRLGLGDRHSCALASGAAGPVLWCWGDNGSGQGGGGAGTLPTPTEVTLDAAVPPTLIAAGRAHTCVAGPSTRSMRCLGANGSGQLGAAAGTGAVTVPIPGEPYGVAAGGDHSCAVQTNGELYCWGSNGRGEVGNPTACPGSCSTPTQPTGL
jgi:alpha-tubulin suppressor-like RCC1 family protein